MLSAAPNKGAPGVDRQDFEAVAAYVRWRRWLGESGACAPGRRPTDRTLSDVCTYRSANGKLRPLGISTLAGSGLHDSSDAGAGADLRSRPSIGTLRLLVPGENAQQAVVGRWKSCCFCGHPEVVDAGTASRTTSGAFPMPELLKASGIAPDRRSALVLGT